MRRRLATFTGCALFVLAFIGQAHAQDGTWSGKAPMVTGRTWLQAEVIEGIVYAVGGANGGCPGASPLASEAYNPVTDTWTARTALPPPPGNAGHRGAFATAALDGHLYAFGGGNCLTFFSDVQVYDPGSDTWIARNPMPSARVYAVAAAVNGKIYVLGGYDQSGTPSPTWEYEPSTQAWVTKAAMTTSRLDAGVAVIDDKIYVVGGSSPFSGEVLSTVDVYDPTTDTWSGAASMATPRLNPAVAAINGVLYAFGGADASYGIVDSGEAYDPALDVWSAAPSLPAARNGSGAAVVGNVLYVMGGQSNSVAGNPETFAFTASGGGAGDPGTDTDNDGIVDEDDNCPSLANADQADFDGDAAGDACDPDDDDDGVNDQSDAFPLNALESADTDGDGAGNNADADDDNDGIEDGIDIEPLAFSDGYAVDAVTVGSIVRNGHTISLIQPASPPTGFQLLGAAALGSGADARFGAACGGQLKEIRLGHGDAARWRCNGTTLTVRGSVGSPEVWKNVCVFAPGHFSCRYQIVRLLGPNEEVSTGSPVTAGPGNTAPIPVEIRDDVMNLTASFQLDPGESVDVQMVVGAAGTDALQLNVLSGGVTVTSFGRTTTLSAGGGPQTFALVSIDDLASELASFIDALDLKRHQEKSALKRLDKVLQSIAADKKNRTKKALNEVDELLKQVSKKQFMKNLTAAEEAELVARLMALRAAI